MIRCAQEYGIPVTVAVHSSPRSGAASAAYGLECELYHAIRAGWYYDH